VYGSNAIRCTNKALQLRSFPLWQTPTYLDLSTEKSGAGAPLFALKPELRLVDVVLVGEGVERGAIGRVEKRERSVVAHGDRGHVIDGANTGE
jgi:hypothetical protein